MRNGNDYELVDFGRGRKLERFGAVLLDRPSPGVEDVPLSDRTAWPQANARYDRLPAGGGGWTCRTPMSHKWPMQWGSCVFELQLGHSGAVGLFPEQAENWEWISRQVLATAEPIRILNLFGYTGGSTLAAAAVGASVVHVDAARPVVNWARHNAAQSELAAKPIRWIIDDARQFVARELRRKQEYHAVILDPPTYGHGPRAEAWQIDSHLPTLLADCAQLMRRQPLFAVLSCHTPHVGPADLAAMLKTAFEPLPSGHLESLPLTLATAGGRLLPSGICARWSVRS
jgi:23S rRNA (cytosine1962-C5)-methyltransferase